MGVVKLQRFNNSRNNCIIQHPCQRVPNLSVELAQKENLVLADGADKAQSASDRPQPGMHDIPGLIRVKCYAPRA